MSTPERIQKIIAQAGLASRREAEELIAEGLVTVNGKTAKLGDKATLGEDAIKVKGKLIQNAEHKVYYLFYKPKNVIAMINEDEEGRDTIKTYTRGIKERVFTVGRMDFSGEGAILLTNDGEMAQKITKSDELIRRYHVKVDRHPTQEDLARLARGGRIEKVSMMPHHIRVVQEYAKNALIEVSFQGSGMTEVRKFFENKGFFPEKVVRVGIGHLKADTMKPGEIKRIEASSMEALFAQPELTKKQIETMVKTATKKKTDSDEKADRPSRRPPRNRPLPAERAAGIKRAPRGDMPMPRFKREDRGFGERKQFGEDRRPFGGDRKPSFGRGAPRGDRFADRAAREDGIGMRERKSFGRGDKPARFGDRSFDRSDRKPSFGRGAPRGGSNRPARSFGGDRPSFGDRARGDRPQRSFGDRPSFGGERKSFGDRKPSFGRGAPRGGSDRPARSFGGDRPARGGAGGRSSFQPRFKRG